MTIVQKKMLCRLKDIFHNHHHHHNHHQFTMALTPVTDMEFEAFPDKPNKIGLRFISVMSSETNRKFEFVMPNFAQAPFGANNYKDEVKKNGAKDLSLVLEDDDLEKYLRTIEDAVLGYMAKNSEKFHTKPRTIDHLRDWLFQPMVREDTEARYASKFKLKVTPKTIVKIAASKTELKPGSGTIEDIVPWSRIRAQIQIDWIYMNSKKNFGITLKAKSVVVLPPEGPVDDGIVDDDILAKTFNMSAAPPSKKRQKIGHVAGVDNGVGVFPRDTAIEDSV